MRFKQDGAISTLNNKSLILVNHFPYISSRISSIERNAYIRIGKTRTAMDRLSIIWKSNLSIGHMEVRPDQ